MKKQIIAIASLLLTVGLQASPERRNNVYFDVNGTTLSTTAKLLLDTVYEKLPETNYMRIIPVGGVVDQSISSASDIYYNRARAIYEYYTQAGVKEENLEIIDLRKNGATSSGLSMGTYRVNDLEVRVYKALEKEEAAFTSLKDYFQTDVQRFLVDASEEISITGKQGTILNFPMNAFECVDGTDPNEGLTIELSEYYSYADLLKSDLHTMSNGYMLETGGTINVNAQCKNSEAVLQDGVVYDIEFPVKGWYKDGMQTFIGEEEAEGQVNWLASEDGIDSFDGIIWDEEWEAWDTFYVENPEPPYDISLVVSGRRKNNAVLDKYMLSSGELGYINCDRFLDEPNVTDFVVNVDTTFNAGVRMVFKDIKSVMSGDQYERGKISFSGIPVGQVVTLVACSIKDDVPYLAMKEIRITEGGYDQLKLVKTTKADLESKFLALK